MKYVAIILTVILAACAPVAQVLQPGEKATIDQQGLSLLIVNPGPDALTGDPSVPGDGPALNVRGVNIKPDAAATAWCKQAPVSADMVRWICNLPALPADPNQAPRVTFVANDAGMAARLTSASLAAYRVSKGAVPMVVYAK